MKRLRTPSVSRPEALDRRNAKSAWGGCYWRGVNLRKRLECQRRESRAMRDWLARNFVTVSPPLPLDGEPAIEAAARLVH